MTYNNHSHPMQKENYNLVHKLIFDINKREMAGK